MSDNAEYQLSEEEWGKIAELSIEARRAPVMLVGGVDISASAHDDVYRYWEELGRKYGFDARHISPVDTKKRIIRARPAVRTIA